MSAGRRPKIGLDFAGWEVDVLDNDTKIGRLIEAQGIAAFTVYFYLCQHAYATHGYYLDWDYSCCVITARKLGKGASAEFVKNVVDMCFQCCLFDKRLFELHGVLTSQGIQRRYFNAIQDRVNKYKPKEFWLLKPEECQGFDLCTQNSNFQAGNDTDSTEQNSTEHYITEDIPLPSAEASAGINYQKIVDAFNRLCTSLPKVIALTDARRTAIRKAADRLGGIDRFEEFFKRVEASDFLSGRNKKWGNCGFDWCLKAGNLLKILEGQYDNKGKAVETESAESEYEEMVQAYVPTYQKKKR